MNIKQHFEVIVSIVAIVGFVYASNLLLSTSVHERENKMLLINGVLCLLFFTPEINLIHASNNRSIII